jgi:hypothetical protein
MMDYVQDYPDDAGFGGDDGRFMNDARTSGHNAQAEGGDEEGGTPFAVAVARFGQEPYIPAPKIGFTRYAPPLYDVIA